MVVSNIDKKKNKRLRFEFSSSPQYVLYFRIDDIHKISKYVIPAIMKEHEAMGVFVTREDIIREQTQVGGRHTRRWVNTRRIHEIWELARL